MPTGIWYRNRADANRRQTSGSFDPSGVDGGRHMDGPSQHAPGSGVWSVTLILALSSSTTSSMYPTGLHLTSKPISASPTVLGPTWPGVDEKQVALNSRCPTTRAW